MSSTLASAISAHVRDAIAQQASTWILATVTATYTSTLDIATATGPVLGVRRLRSYSSPAVGDVVQVDRNSDGNWIVVGALAP